MITNKERNKEWVEVLAITILIIGSFTRIGVLHASTCGNLPIVSKVLVIMNPTINIPIIPIAIGDTISVKVEPKTGKLIETCDSTHEMPFASFHGSRYGIQRIAFSKFLKENWQIPEHMKNDTSYHVIPFTIVFDENGNLQKINKGHKWAEMNYCLHIDKLTIVEDSLILEGLAKVMELAPPFDFIKNYNYRHGLRCTGASYCIVIKMNELSVHEYRWDFTQIR